MFLKHLRNRWRQEYFIESWEFNKIKSRYGISVKPNIIDVVLIEDKNLKRMHWRIGKIDELFFMS